MHHIMITYENGSTLNNTWNNFFLYSIHLLGQVQRLRDFIEFITITDCLFTVSTLFQIMEMN